MYSCWWYICWVTANSQLPAPLQGLVKHFFNEKEVTSTLVMDALYSGCRQIDQCTHEAEVDGQGRVSGHPQHAADRFLTMYSGRSICNGPELCVMYLRLCPRSECAPLQCGIHQSQACSSKVPQCWG